MDYKRLCTYASTCLFYQIHHPVDVRPGLASLFQERFTAQQE